MYNVLTNAVGIEFKWIHQHFVLCLCACVPYGLDKIVCTSCILHIEEARTINTVIMVKLTINCKHEIYGLFQQSVCIHYTIRDYKDEEPLKHSNLLAAIKTRPRNEIERRVCEVKRQSTKPQPASRQSSLKILSHCTFSQASLSFHRAAEINKLNQATVLHATTTHTR